MAAKLLGSLRTARVSRHQLFHMFALDRSLPPHLVIRWLLKSRHLCRLFCIVLDCICRMSCEGGRVFGSGLPWNKDLEGSFGGLGLYMACVIGDRRDYC